MTQLSTATTNEFPFFCFVVVADTVLVVLWSRAAQHVPGLRLPPLGPAAHRVDIVVSSSPLRQFLLERLPPLWPRNTRQQTWHERTAQERHVAVQSQSTNSWCTQTHTHAHARTRARTHAHTHARTHARTHAHTHTHTHARARTHAHTYIHTYNYIYMICFQKWSTPVKRKTQYSVEWHPLMTKLNVNTF